MVGLIDVCEVRIVQLQHWVGIMILRTEGHPEVTAWKSRDARLVRALDGLTNRRARRAHRVWASPPITMSGASSILRSK